MWKNGHPFSIFTSSKIIQIQLQVHKNTRDSTKLLFMKQNKAKMETLLKTASSPGSRSFWTSFNDNKSQLGLEKI